jgi:hypothetical protein
MGASTVERISNKYLLDIIKFIIVKYFFKYIYYNKPIYTLEDLNPHTYGVLYLFLSRATLPINELKRTTAKGGCADLNLHRCYTDQKEK